MHRCFNIISAFFLVALFSACATAVYVPLEILRPAEAALPDSIHKLAIVINAPERTPKEDEGEIVDIHNVHQRLQIERENLIPHFTKSLSRSLRNASGRMLSIIRMKNDSVTGDILPSHKIGAIRDSLKADAILSLDELSVIPSIKLKRINDVFVFGDLNVIVRANLKLYNGYEVFPHIYSCIDTVSWQSYGETEDLALKQFPSFQDCLIEAASYSGQQVCKKFYSYIDNVDRYYFVTLHPLMKEANLYWTKGSYEEASFLWEYIYDNAGKMERKAKAAANMALYEELNDRYESALNWIKKSLDIFTESPDRYSDYIEYLLDYQQQLKVRIRENR